MFVPTSSSDHYIQLNKKITNKEVIKEVLAVSTELLITPCEACYRFIAEGALREKQKRERLQNIVK